MKIAWLILVLLLGICQQADQQIATERISDLVHGVQNAAAEGEVLFVEIQEGDFVLRIESEKSSYRTDEEINLQAMLKYVGNKPSENIYHAASPFYLSVTNRTHNLSSLIFMNQPLITTKLKKGEWFAEDYPVPYELYLVDSLDLPPDKWEHVQIDHYPKGEYTFNASANFIPDQSRTK